MLRKMLDPDGACDVDIAETAKYVPKLRESLLFPLRERCGRTHLPVDGDVDDKVLLPGH